MQALSGASSHILLNRKDNPASHSTRKAASGPSSAFATYAFGPMDLPDKNKGTDVEGARKNSAQGNKSVAAATGGSVGWLTQLAVSQNIK
ncbi:hypothetical protein A6A04_08765 [Paramagnetospirillum marisnigri]|uniref:Uncharacterized protein n=1 Tax=Paramagnetospirillum marisnigri TaxID=1285242 RepID=A0A178M7U5_9PROT|nr:hypothetical protein [Paramagnetospirillum marisnigri]OAN43964.1 hypothetical protein A6A04_08765 [Paramagnetospirillum marisnigri]